MGPNSTGPTQTQCSFIMHSGRKNQIINSYLFTQKIVKFNQTKTRVSLYLTLTENYSYIFTIYMQISKSITEVLAI